MPSGVGMSRVLGHRRESLENRNGPRLCYLCPGPVLSARDFRPFPRPENERLLAGIDPTSRLEALLPSA